MVGGLDGRSTAKVDNCRDIFSQHLTIRCSGRLRRPLSCIVRHHTCTKPRRRLFGRSNMKQFILVVFLLLVAGCASTPKPADPPATDPKLILILVGGNSEAIHDGGIWKIYKGSLSDSSSSLLSNLRKATSLKKSEIATYYFSWTGDDESLRNHWLPGHGSWITGGSGWIKTAMQGVLLSVPASTQIAIVGWSNGGATAYELACTLSAVRVPELLVTLDPVSWTTQSCAHYSDRRRSSPENWINVYTESGLWSRLNAGNIIALIGRAWDSDKLPSQISEKSLHKLENANHGDTEKMWPVVLKDESFIRWASSFRSK